MDRHSLRHVPIGPLMTRSSENSTVVLVGNGKA